MSNDLHTGRDRWGLQISGPDTTTGTRHRDDPRSTGDGRPPSVTDGWSVVIDRDEWSTITSSLRHALGPDERSPYGNYHLRTSGSCRVWTATDRRRSMTYTVGCPSDVARLISSDPEVIDRSTLVSPRLLEAWPSVAGSSGSAVLRITHPGPDDRRVAILEGPGGSISVDAPDGGDVGPEYPTVAIDPDSHTSFRVDRSTLIGVLTLSCSRPPIDDEGRAQPLMWLQLEDRTLTIEIDWEDLGATRYRLAVHGCGHVSVPVDPRLLHEMVASLGDGDLHVGLPTAPGGTVMIGQGQLGGVFVSLDPMHPVVTAVEETLEDVFGTAATIPDGDGYYLLGTEGIPIHARIDAATHPRLVMGSTIVRGVHETTELLTELNQLNSVTGTAGIRLHGDSIVVSGELVAATLDPTAVVEMYRRIRSVGEDLASLLATRYGGAPVPTGRETRRNLYMAAVVTAEISPGRWVRLNGRDAVADLPARGRMFAIAEDRHLGVAETAEMTDHGRGTIAYELAHADAGFARAIWSGDGWAERTGGYVVWDIDARLLTSIARRYGHHAIYELESDRMVLITADGSEPPLAHPRSALPQTDTGSTRQV